MLADQCQLSCWNAMLPILSAACLLHSSHHLATCRKWRFGLVHAQMQQGSWKLRLNALACKCTEVQLLFQPHARACSSSGAAVQLHVKWPFLINAMCVFVYIYLYYLIYFVYMYMLNQVRT